MDTEFLIMCAPRLNNLDDLPVRNMVKLKTTSKLHGDEQPVSIGSPNVSNLNRSNEIIPECMGNGNLAFDGLITFFDSIPDLSHLRQPTAAEQISNMADYDQLRNHSPASDYVAMFLVLLHVWCRM